MQREELIAGVEAALERVQGLPVAFSVLTRLGLHLKREEPKFWKALSNSLDRRYASPASLGHQLLTCVHYSALADIRSPLAPFFPTAGGKPGDGLAEAVDRFWAEPGGRFLDCLGNRSKVYLQAPGLAWAYAAEKLFGRRSRPFHVVEISCGIGANLIADQCVEAGLLAPGLVQGRVGLDSAPLRPDSKENQRWAVAALMPDEAAEAAKLRTHLEWTAGQIKEDDTFLQLIPCATVLAAKAIARSVPPHEDFGLLVYGVGATSMLAPAPYAALMADVDHFLKYWGPEAVWLEIEPPPSPAAHPLEMRARRFLDGTIRRERIAYWSASPTGLQLDWDQAGWAAVDPAR